MNEDLLKEMLAKGSVSFYPSIDGYRCVWRTPFPLQPNQAEMAVGQTRSSAADALVATHQLGIENGIVDHNSRGRVYTRVLDDGFSTKDGLS